MHVEALGPLRARVLGAQDQPTASVVLLHGFGAPGSDLVGLAGELSVPEGTLLVFPEAPHAIDVGLPPPYEGRAWWHIDMLRLQLAVQTGSFEAMAQHVPEGLAEARQTLDEFLEALDARYGLAGKPRVLGGFSQGAMLSTDVALHANSHCSGLLLLSGSLIAAPEWGKLLETRAPLPFFQSHGRHDPVLPFSLAERLHAMLVSHAWPGRFVSFAGGHGIAPEAVAGMNRFLAGLLGA